MLAQLLRALSPYQPTLIGTFPLGLQVDGSDFDIACTCDDLHGFERSLRATLADLGLAARIKQSPRSPAPAVVATFALDDAAVEIFAQTLPVTAQRGFRHMVIEGQLLVLGGPVLAARVRDLKRQGMKTEPAFAHLLGLPGDPYASLLTLETASPDQLRALVARALAMPSDPMA